MAMIEWKNVRQESLINQIENCVFPGKGKYKDIESDKGE